MKVAMHEPLSASALSDQSLTVVSREVEMKQSAETKAMQRTVALWPANVRVWCLGTPLTRA